MFTCSSMMIMLQPLESTPHESLAQCAVDVLLNASITLVANANLKCCRCRDMTNVDRSVAVMLRNVVEGVEQVLTRCCICANAVRVLEISVNEGDGLTVSSDLRSIPKMCV